MSLQRIFKALVILGLSQIDARVYIFLALKGPEEALSIVRNLKTTKQQICQSLKHLQDKGIIISDTENGKMFSALPFEEVLKSLLRKEKEQNKMMQKILLENWRIMIRRNSKT